MGQSPSVQEGAVLEQQYQSSLTLFTSYEQGEIKQIFDAICKTPVTELEESLLGFEKSQLQVSCTLARVKMVSTTTRHYCGPMLPTNSL